MKTEEFTFFWATASPFSQWHPCQFEINGMSYNCAEQYMMQQKALCFGDQKMARLIMQTDNPGKQKALGRKVKAFNPKVWDRSSFNIVYRGNYAKFTQNEALKKHLLSTKGTELVEASPVDFIWGIDLAADDPRSRIKSKWRGENRLGKVLTKLRDHLATENEKV